MLKGWRFAFSSENGAQTGLAVNRSFAAGAVVKSAFQSDSVLVLDELTVEDMARLGRAEYPIDFSISLDTEALSYIHPHLVHPTRRLPQDFQEVLLPEGLLAQKYFLMGQNLRFFGKVQTKKPNLLRTVNGMAWDLVHRRNLDSTIGADLERGARYFFPAILMFDKGLAEVMDLYSLRACAIAPESGGVIPNYAHGAWDRYSPNLVNRDV